MVFKCKKYKYIHNKEQSSLIFKMKFNLESICIYIEKFTLTVMFYAMLMCSLQAFNSGRLLSSNRRSSLTLLCLNKFRFFLLFFLKEFKKLTQKQRKNFVKLCNFSTFILTVRYELQKNL